eukprot:TRINITY_DN8779_c0_g1_i2.p1 TRINITY_DN8779_c0_g1~~TRINITY_DN8779_c0_g1_i2.p1  ORF type:complete len:553 (+),score=95.61 TRINITY_DN8779_c0_g1_i2:30-1688(+)
MELTGYDIWVPKEIVQLIINQLCWQSTQVFGCTNRFLYDMCTKDPVWMRLYQLHWYNCNILRLNRSWYTCFKDRYYVESTYLQPHMEDIEKDIKERAESCTATSSKGHTFSKYLNNKYVIYGEKLRTILDTALPEDRPMIVLISGEQYASAVADTDNYIAYFNWGYILNHYAKYLSNESCEEVFFASFEKYEIAYNSKDNIVSEETLSRWGEAIHDFAKTKKSKKEIEKWLNLSYEKFEASVNIKPNYLAYDSWGLSLYTNAKLKVSQPEQLDMYFSMTYEKYENAHILQPDDGYILCHWANTLQHHGALAADDAYEDIFRECFEKFEITALCLGEDAFMYRCWGDALHEYAKRIIDVAEVIPDNVSLKKLAFQHLIRAGLKYQYATELKSDYTNAINNWALCLSTHAKLLSHLSDKYFQKSYKKFEEALQYTEDEEGYITCNWAMTLISQASKKYENNDLKGYKSLLKSAREKLETRIEKGDTWSLFCMARWCSSANKENECRLWLEKFQEKDKYLHKATKEQLSYFTTFEEKSWFKEVMQKAIIEGEDIL